MWGEGWLSHCLPGLSQCDRLGKQGTQSTSGMHVWGVPKLKHETYMCAFMYACRMPRVQMCLCMSARVLIEQMAFAHGTSAQPYTPVLHHAHVHNCAQVCVCVCLPAAMPHLPLREELWLLGHSSCSQADLRTSLLMVPGTQHGFQSLDNYSLGGRMEKWGPGEYI